MCKTIKACQKYRECKIDEDMIDLCPFSARCERKGDVIRRRKTAIPVTEIVTTIPKKKTHAIEHICSQCGEIIELMGNNHNTVCPECGNIGVRDSKKSDIWENEHLKRNLKNSFALSKMKTNKCPKCSLFCDCKKMYDMRNIVCPSLIIPPENGERQIPRFEYREDGKQCKKIKIGEDTLIPLPREVFTQKTICSDILLPHCCRLCDKKSICKIPKNEFPSLCNSLQTSKGALTIQIPQCPRKNECNLQFWELDLCKDRKSLKCPKTEKREIETMPSFCRYGIHFYADIDQIPEEGRNYNRFWEMVDHIDDYNFTPTISDFVEEIRNEKETEMLNPANDITQPLSRSMSTKKYDRIESDRNQYVPGYQPQTRKDRKEAIEKSQAKQQDRRKLSAGIKHRDHLIKLLEYSREKAQAYAAKLSIFDWQAINYAGGIPKYIEPRDDGESDSNIHH